MENKELTGYPHIDKPWMKYYDENLINKMQYPQMNIYDYMLHCNTSLDNVAMSYYGKKIRYGEMNEKIQDAAKILTSFGVENGDRVMYLMPNIPETAYLMYGGSMIGAVSDYIDPRPDSIDMKISAQKVLSMIKEEKCKHLVVLDMCFLGMIKPIENELKEIGIESIIVVSPSNSMDTKATINYLNETINFEGLKQAKEKLSRTKQMKELIEEAKKNSCIKVLDYGDLEKNNKYTLIKRAAYEPDKMEIIVHTSGTTSARPKPIPLTNDNINSYVEQADYSNIKLYPNDKMLHILPYFAAFGLVTVVHGGLCRDNELIEIPEFSPYNLGKIVKKYKPQTLIGTPSWFVNLLSDPAIRNTDLSFLKMAIYGGDSMDPEDEKKVNEFLKKHNCSTMLTKGHGMSELCGCSSYSTGEYNRIGSFGIPLAGTTYALIDPETKELKKFNDDEETIEGEIVISSPSVTKGIIDGKVIVPHYNIGGMDCICTGDIAKMDKDGVMSFLTRKNRSFTRFDGYKVKPYEIENVIKENPYVEHCAITPFYSEKEHGNAIKANIVLKDIANNIQPSEIVENILRTCFIENPNVSSRQMPARFSILEKLPETKNGKIDYNSLANLNPELDIIVSIDENNISVNSIEIIEPNNNCKKLSLKN